MVPNEHIIKGPGWSGWLGSLQSDVKLRAEWWIGVIKQKGAVHSVPGKKKHMQRPCVNSKWPVWGMGVREQGACDMQPPRSLGTQPQGLGPGQGFYSLSWKKLWGLKEKSNISDLCFEGLSGCRGWASGCWGQSGHQGPKRRLLEWSRWTHGQGNTTDLWSCFLSMGSHSLPEKWSGTFHCH